MCSKRPLNSYISGTIEDTRILKKLLKKKKKKKAKIADADTCLMLIDLSRATTITSCCGVSHVLRSM